MRPSEKIFSDGLFILLYVGQLNFCSSSFARVHPAASSNATEIVGATTLPKPGINFDNSFAIVFMGCFNMVFLIAAIAIALAAASVILPPKTAQRLVHMVVIVTISVAIPSPGTGTALPAAAAIA